MNYVLCTAIVAVVAMFYIQHVENRSNHEIMQINMNRGANVIQAWCATLRPGDYAQCLEEREAPKKPKGLAL